MYVCLNFFHLHMQMCVAQWLTENKSERTNASARTNKETFKVFATLLKKQHFTNKVAVCTMTHTRTHTNPHTHTNTNTSAYDELWNDRKCPSCGRECVTVKIAFLPNRYACTAYMHIGRCAHIDAHGWLSDVFAVIPISLKTPNEGDCDPDDAISNILCNNAARITLKTT